MKRAIAATGVVFLTLPLGGCLDYLLKQSQFNLTSEQLADIKTQDIVNRPEFTVNISDYLTKQIVALDTKIQSRGAMATAPQSPMCAPTNITIQALPAVYGGNLSQDKVIRVSLATVSSTAVQRAEPIGALTYADFENFTRSITDASLLNQPTFVFQGVNPAPPSETVLSATVPATGSGSPVLSYIGAYYNGNFVDRFGNPITKPTFSSGVQDATISNFVRVLLEAGFDAITPHEPVLQDSSGKWIPNNKEPTFTKVFGDTPQPPAVDGSKGVSLAEYAVIVAGANEIADQGLTLFSGFLKSLGAINIGLVIAPKFSIGDNSTLEDVAQAVIETTLRRGAERGLYCLMEKYNFDDVAAVINAGNH